MYLNPGTKLFEEAIHDEIYVDKTQLIQYTNKCLNTKSKYICVSRPRRFGKTTAADMLAAYYDISCDSSKIFRQFCISKGRTAKDPMERRAYRAYQKNRNKYPVLKWDMKTKLTEAQNDIKKLLELLKIGILSELKESYPEAFSQEPHSLVHAFEMVYRYTGIPFVFIIDEWDCVMRKASFSDEDHILYLDELRAWFKDQEYVALLYMTGILPVKKYGDHSALNMCTEISMIEPRKMAELIGFTEAEVEKLCQTYHLDFAQTKEWYDGYLFENDIHIYNPKSVVESILNGRFASYWTRTETYEALKCYLDLNMDGLKDSVVRMIAGEHIRINTEKFQNDMRTFRSKDDVLTLLIHLGYLAFDWEKSEVFIPNFEVRGEFKNAIEASDWSEVVNALKDSDKLLQATWQKDEKMVASMIEAVHSANTSLLKYNDENSLSMCMNLAYFNAMNHYTIIRELPSGKGFADLVFLPKPKSDKPAMIIELKYNKNAGGAIKQIKEKNYPQTLKAYHGNLLLVGINYGESKGHSCKIEEFVL